MIHFHYVTFYMVIGEQVLRVGTLTLYNSLIVTKKI